MLSFERVGEAVALQVTKNGKGRATVTATPTDSGQPIVDKMNVLVACERQRFVKLLPADAQSEAAELLGSIAADLSHAAEPVTPAAGSQRRRRTSSSTP